MRKHLTAAKLVALYAMLLGLGCGYVETTEVAAPRTPRAGASGGGGGGGSFASAVLPVLLRVCGDCHGASTATSGIDISSYDSITAVAGLVVPGNPDNSLLVQVIEEGRMPPSGTGLTAEELDALRAWIAQGAEDN